MGLGWRLEIAKETLLVIELQICYFVLVDKLITYCRRRKGGIRCEESIKCYQSKSSILSYSEMFQELMN